MEQTKCIECGKEIPENATVCPYCGHPVRYQEDNSGVNSMNAKATEHSLWDDVIALVDGGQKLEAIKKVGEATGVAVSSCQAVLNRIEETKTVPKNIGLIIDLLKQADRSPDSALSCLKCGAKYPSGLRKCPVCNTSFTGGYLSKRTNPIKTEESRSNRTSDQEINRAYVANNASSYVRSIDVKTFRDLVKEAKEHPDFAVRCASCLTPYPNRLPRCPGCGASNESNIKNHNTSNSGTVPSKPRIRLTPCPACGKQISTQAESCPHCGQPTGVHVCPKCGSTNTKVISGASKATSLFLWGPFAANKVMSKYQCKDCLHKF